MNLKDTLQNVAFVELFDCEGDPLGIFAYNPAKYGAFEIEEAMAEALTEIGDDAEDRLTELTLAMETKDIHRLRNIESVSPDGI